jgi:hypothetical protein
LAIAGLERRGVPAAIFRGRIGPTDIEGLQLGQRQILDARRGTRDPRPASCSTNLGLEAKVVEYDDFAFLGELDIQLRPVGSVPGGSSERRERILGQEAGPPAVGNVEHVSR